MNKRNYLWGFVTGAVIFFPLGIFLTNLHQEALVSTGLMVPLVTPTPKVYDAHSALTRDDVFVLYNDARIEAGLKELPYDDAAVAEAQKRADAITISGICQHNLDNHIYGELVECGEPDAPDVIDDWMHSPAHKTAMLDPKATSVGVGVSAKNVIVLYKD